MTILSQLTPAETLLLKDCHTVKLKDLMKYTFIDLLLKQVLEVKEVSKRPHPRDDIRTYTYVFSGKNFNNYTPKNHELIFIEVFQKSPSLQILFKNYVEMVYGLAKGKSSYKKLIRRNQQINKYFKQTFFVDIFRLTRLNDRGVTIQKELTKYFDTLETNIDNLLNNNKEEGLELLLKIRGNIFLLKNLDFQLLKKIDKEFIKRRKKSNVGSQDSYDDWWFYTDFDDLDYSFNSCGKDFEDTIDTYESENDSSGWSSCDSGCTSCGGCGGCD